VYDIIAQNPLSAALVALVSLSIIFGAILGYAAVKFKVEGDPIVEQIDKLLPQTQCGQCGYPGCKPYAQALADGDSINKCPPGGQTTINAIADLLDVEAPALDVEHGEESDVRTVAYIREDECIGCTKCIQACPVDAILGAAKLMHTVIASECTGCDLCVEPCPVDCIDMLPVEKGLADWKWELPPTVEEQILTISPQDIIASDLRQVKNKGNKDSDNSGDKAA
jgi:electron transport complex protein RnfB